MARRDVAQTTSPRVRASVTLVHRHVKTSVHHDRRGAWGAGALGSRLAAPRPPKPAYGQQASSSVDGFEGRDIGRCADGWGVAAAARSALLARPGQAMSSLVSGLVYRLRAACSREARYQRNPEYQIGWVAGLTA